MNKLSKLIVGEIEGSIKSSPHSSWYRGPVIGFADAHDPSFAQLKKLVSPNHLTPQDLLPQARTVMAFFIPFSDEIIVANQNTPFVAREWALAYIETNQLMGDICMRLFKVLNFEGVGCAWEKPTHNFDETNLISYWSHKHVAYICGLGSFGLHHMLITPKGCAGRIGSMVIDTHITPSPKVGLYQYCGYYQDGSCRWCIEACPTGALGENRFDRHRCYKQLLEVDRFYPDLDLCDVCGKCAVGPCALGVYTLPLSASSCLRK